MSLLSKALGFSESEVNKFKQILRSVSDDMPFLLKRVGEIEILIKALALYHREENPELWRKCLEDSKNKCKKQNDKFQTQLRNRRKFN